MPKLYLLCCVQLTIAIALYAQKRVAYDTSRKFAADTIVSSIQHIVKELAIKHPGFYRYHTKAAFGHYIDSVTQTITDSLTEIQMYHKLKPIVSHIGCLHSGVQLSKDHLHYLNTMPNLFPFQIYFLDNRAFIIKNFQTIRHCNPARKYSV